MKTFTKTKLYYFRMLTNIKSVKNKDEQGRGGGRQCRNYGKKMHYPVLPIYLYLSHTHTQNTSHI